MPSNTIVYLFPLEARRKCGLTGHIAGHRGIVRPRDFVDLVDVDDTSLCLVDIAICCTQKLVQHALHILQAPKPAELGELPNDSRQHGSEAPYSAYSTWWLICP